MSDLEVGRITIRRVLTDDGDQVDYVDAVDPDGDELGLTTSLGMLRLAEDTLLHPDPEGES